MLHISTTMMVMWFCISAGILYMMEQYHMRFTFDHSIVSIMIAAIIGGVVVYIGRMIG